MNALLAPSPLLPARPSLFPSPSLSASRDGRERGPVMFDTVMLCEDPATGAAAKRVADIVSHEMGADCHFITALWHIALLDDPLFHESASQQAAAADIAIVSLRSETGLPLAVRGWIHRWTHCRQGAHAALIALFAGPAHPAADRARADLKGIADRASLSFLTETVRNPMDDESASDVELFYVM